MSPAPSAYRLLGDSFPDSPTADPPESVIFTCLDRRKQIEKSLLRKLDLRVGFLTLVYLMQWIDMNNVASARLNGLEEDLRMTGNQFNTLISVFFVGYVLMQIPSTGACKNFPGALASRFFLGLSEAAFYPGVLLLLSKWYKRDELGLRMAYFSCGAKISGMFGPLIAAGTFSTLDGKFGYAAWRWLFFMEGSLTCAIAAAAFYMIPDFPTTPVSWLTIEEQVLAQKRMEEDLGDVTNIQLKREERPGLVNALTDWTVWWLAIAIMAVNISMSYTAFLPTLVATMGYSPAITLLLCVPPTIGSVIVTVLVTQHSDASRDRFWHIVGPLSMGIIGLVTATLTMNPSIRYLSFISMRSSAVSYILVLTWMSNSVPESASKRAVALAFLNVSACSAEIGTPYMGPDILQIVLDLRFGVFDSYSYVVGVSITPYETEQERRNERACTGFADRI
ncbi:hypothetical protein ID866_5630 [Astraeus odoratus]|nr:hypothetical protein ID866_5630 [Astraeus odoratus]